MRLWSLLACTLQGPHQAAPGRARWSRGRSGPRAYVAFKPTALWLHVRLLCGYMPDCSVATCPNALWLHARLLRRETVIFFVFDEFRAVNARVSRGLEA